MLRSIIVVLALCIVALEVSAQLYSPEIKVQSTAGVYIGSNSIGGAFGVQGEGEGIRFFNQGAPSNYLEFGRRSSEKLEFSVDDVHAYLDYRQDNDGNAGHSLFIRNLAYLTSSNSYNDIRIQANQGKITIRPNGKVGVNTIVPQYELHVNDSAYCTGAQWVGSDIKLKKNITDYDKGLALVKKLRPIEYELKAKADSVAAFNKKSSNKEKKKSHKYVSVVAQELQELAPDLVDVFMDDNDEASLAINQTSLTYVLINAVKELATQVEQQQQLIQALQKQN